MPTGTAVLDFGSSVQGKTDATAIVTGQTGIVAGSHIEAYFMAATTSDHNADEHRVAATLIDLVCGQIVPGTGFTIFAIAPDGPLRGQFIINWVWI